MRRSKLPRPALGNWSGAIRRLSWPQAAPCARRSPCQFPGVSSGASVPYRGAMPPQPIQRRVEALIERCYAGLDDAAPRRQVASRLKALAGVDAAFIATVDPATLLFTSAISEDPLIEAAPAFLANELDGRDVNRFIDLAAGLDPARTLDEATRGDRDSSARHAAIMRPLGLGDELRVALRTRHAIWWPGSPRTWPGDSAGPCWPGRPGIPTRRWGTGWSSSTPPARSPR